MARQRNARLTSLRIAVIGAGTMGQIHAACYAADRAFTFIGCYNPTRAKAEALVAEHGGRVFDDVQSLVTAADVDAVCIASPQAHHHAQVIATAEAGKHIFCEKPVALTAKELDDIDAAVAKAGITFMTGHQMRFHPVIVAVRQALKRLGRVYHLDMEWCFRIAGHEGRCWETYRLGGFFMELGCHAADLACFLLGKPVHVSGHTLRIDPKRVTEDYTHALLQFEDHAVASLLVSANHRTKRQGLLIGRVIGEKGRIDFTVYPFSRSLNKATLTIDHGREVFVPDVTVSNIAVKQGRSLTKVFPGFFDVYAQEAATFARAARNGTTPPCTLADGRNAIEIVLATYHQQGQATKEKNFINRPKRYASDGDCHPLLGSR